jgi:hypothetical protein
MSEELQIPEELLVTEPEEVSIEVEETPEEVHEPTPLEQEAKSQGWTSLEEWKAAGKDPDKWKSAHSFVEYGKLKSSMEEKLHKLERNFESRLDNVNKLHQLQLENTIKALKQQRMEAVQMADVESYNAIDQRIKEYESALPTATPQEPTKDPMIASWEARNQWIFDNSNPKAVEAKSLWNAYATNNPNATVEDALRYVDDRINKLYPRENPMRDLPTATEKGTRPTTTQKQSLTWDQLSADEQFVWRNGGESLYGNKQAYLKAVLDARGGKK